jgi:predicted permease
VDAVQLLVPIAGLLAFAAIGVALRVSRLLAAEDSKVLNTVLLYSALPAWIFSSVQRAPITPSLVAMPLFGWGIVLVGLVIAWAVARALKLSGPTLGAFMLVAVFGNTGYVGYPLASAMLGDSGLVRAVFSDVFGNTMAVVIVGTLIAARFGEHDVKVNPIREIVTYPPFIALAAALLLHGVTIPIAVSNWLDALGKLVVPTIMISLGLTLKPRAVGGHLVPALSAAAVKLAVLPAIALGVGLVLLHDTDALRIVVLQAGVPSMLLSMIIGQRFKLDVDFIASAILVTMLGAVLTIPLLQLVIR